MTTVATIPDIAIACGGTGGHLFPGLAIAERLVKHCCAVKLLISPKEVDQQAVKNTQGVEVVTLPAVGLQNGNYLAFVRGFWQSWRTAQKLFHVRPPHAALAMGGFTSAPPILVARNRGAMTFLHESNSVPGRANRWLARFVDQAFVGFPSAAKRLHVREATVTGTPIRAEFAATLGTSTATCRAALGLDLVCPLVMVMGGSQGASGVNKMMMSALPVLTERAGHWQWLHLTGLNDFEEVRQTYRALGLNAVVRPFLAEMHLALGAATVAVSRAGASSLAELAAMRLPSLLVPFPFAADHHQFFNARAFAETGAAVMLEQTDATPAKVAGLLQEMVGNAAARERMQAALGLWHTPKAADQIAEMILRLCIRSASKHVRANQTGPLTRGQGCPRSDAMGRQDLSVA